MERYKKIERKDHKKLEAARCDAHKVVEEKPSQVKVKVGGKLMGFVMEKINGMKMSALWFHRCWM